MSGFKFDKNNEELDLSLGSDDGATSKLPAPKPNNTAKKTTGLPSPSISVSKPAPPPIAKPSKPPVTSTKKEPTVPTSGLPKKPIISPNIENEVEPPKPAAVNMPTVVPETSLQTEPAPNKETVEVPPSSPLPVEQHPSQILSNIPAVAPEHISPTEPDDSSVAGSTVEHQIQENVNISIPQASPIVPNKPNVKNVKKSNNKKDKKNGGAFKGNRKVVLFTRIGFGVVGSIVLLAGVNSIFFPKNFPSPDQVIAVVKESLNVTEFPATKGTGFVLGFVETYFTYNPSISGERDSALEQYISKELLQKTDLVFIPENNTESKTPVEQTVVGIPTIVNINSIDNNNAVYTVEVKLSTGNILYVDVPIYWNPKNNGMAVAAPLSIMPAVNLTKVPADNLLLEWTPDKEVAESFEADLVKFLEAWAVSDKTLIDRYSTDGAELNVKLGLENTVKLVRLDKLDVQGLDSKENTVSETERLAIIDVIWADANSPQVTYKQSYLLTIKQKPDKKWYVDKIDTTAYKKK